MSCNEWIGLPTIEDVARAKVEWWEIEMRHSAREWEPWHRASWQVDIAYRGRPAQPKTKTIHMRMEKALPQPCTTTANSTASSSWLQRFGMSKG